MNKIPGRLRAALTDPDAWLWLVLVAHAAFRAAFWHENPEPSTYDLVGPLALLPGPVLAVAWTTVAAMLALVPSFGPRRTMAWRWATGALVGLSVATGVSALVAPENALGPHQHAVGYLTAAALVVIANAKVTPREALGEGVVE